MFSPTAEASEVLCESTLRWDAGAMWAEFTSSAESTMDDSDNSSDQTQDHQTCNISDFVISDMIVTEPSSNDEAQSSNEGIGNTDTSCLYVSMDQLRFCNQESDTSPCTNFDLDRCTNPQWNSASFPDSISSSLSPTFPKSPKRKSVTLVLDLDETLIHSSFERCDDADFTFPVFFDMKELIVFVRQRPYLRVFLEKVSEMFEIVIFTASQSIYAKQLLDILDPDGNIFSQRFYRESCLFTEGCYTKDLTILGVDLAKVAIIDNTPEVFQLQVNNGIPIKSWFDDPSDRELLSLLPLLETIVDAEDVRPIISKKFGNKN